MTNRFATVSNKDLTDLMNNSTAKSTDFNTKVAFKIFSEYCTNNEVNYDQNISKNELDEILSRFYVSARKITGEKYKYHSLQQIRYSLNRYFKKEKDTDIIHDREFKGSCTVFHCLSKTLKKEGFGTVNHHKNIPSEDLKLILSTLSVETPVQLQYKVWVYMMLYFARRGGENLTEMTKESLMIVTGADGRKYVKAGIDVKTKNNQVSSSEESIGGRIYAVGGEKCPVKTIETYIEKLSPNENRFWQRPKDTFNSTEKIWFQNRHHGHSTLSQFMKRICRFCNIKAGYTNHCLRVSACNLLDDAGFKDKDIMSVSGHKSISSLDIYKRTKEDRKMAMSDQLSSAIGLASTSSHSITPQGDLLEIEDDNILAWCDETEKRHNQSLQVEPAAPSFNNCTNCTINVNIVYKS